MQAINTGLPSAPNKRSFTWDEPHTYLFSFFFGKQLLFAVAVQYRVHIQ